MGLLATLLFVAVSVKTQAANSVRLVGAGDIADNGSADVATGNLIEARSNARVFTAGDNAYPNGSASDFSKKYDPAWGSFKNRTYPSPGNHDYVTSRAGAYKNYFGARAVRNGKTYYAYTYGDWRIYALDSNIAMGSGSAQYNFVSKDMRSNGATCELAYYHHATVSTGEHGNQARTKPIFDLFDQRGGDVILAGHDHDYERFAKINSSGKASSAGVREIVVGTGGTGLRPFKRSALPTTERRNSNTQGIIDMTLNANGYRGKFVPAPGRGSFRDSFSGSCQAK